MKKPLENVSVVIGGAPTVVSKKKWMCVKTARRFLSRNEHKIVEVGRGHIATPSFIRRIHDARMILHMWKRKGGEKI